MELSLAIRLWVGFQYTQNDKGFESVQLASELSTDQVGDINAGYSNCLDRACPELI